jgi:hypothetical protein
MDFAAAQMFLTMAKVAHEVGDDRKVVACRKLIAVALEIEEAPHGSRKSDAPGHDAGRVRAGG